VRTGHGPAGGSEHRRSACSYDESLDREQGDRMAEERARALYRLVRRVVISIVGGTVLLIGVALIVLPGPAFVVIPAGLSILALEFAFARRWLNQLAERTGLRKRGDEPSEAKL